MLPDSIRREPDTELHPAMGRDVEAAGGRRQVQLPLQLQVLLGSRFEGAGGQAPAIVSDPIDLDGSCHDFPAPVLAFYALREDARQNGCSEGFVLWKTRMVQAPNRGVGCRRDCVGQMEEGTMKKLALAITALTLGVAGASAQSQTGAGGTVMLTPEQRAAVRSIVRERLPDELQEKLADRLAERLETLTPEQRNAVRAVIRARLAAEVREGLSDRLSERIGDLREGSPGSGIASGEFRQGLTDRLATLTPEQRAAVRSIVRERLPDELREKLADRLAERLEMLTPEQRNAVRAAIGARLAIEVREGLSDRLSEKIGDLRERSPGAGITMEQVSGEIRGRAADRLATLTPEQRAAVRSLIRERLPDELREKVADRLAERLEMLTPEQRDAVRAALRERLGAEVREGLSDRVADRLPGALGNN